MSAKMSSVGEPSHQAGSEFARIEDVLLERLLDAATYGMADGNHEYILGARRLDAPHNLAVFCVAESVEPLRQRRVERLRVSVPLAAPDVRMPRSVLGSDEGHYFYLSYLANRGGIKTSKITPETYKNRFESRRKPPVVDLLGKLGSYRIVPMRERWSETDPT